MSERASGASAASHARAGALAALIAIVALHPLDVIKVRFQGASRIAFLDGLLRFGIVSNNGAQHKRLAKLLAGHAIATHGTLCAQLRRQRVLQASTQAFRCA